MNIRVCFLISNEYIVIVYQFGKHLIGKENYDEKWNKRSNLIKKKYMNKMSKYLRLTWKKTHPFIHFFLFMTFFFHFTRPHLIFFLIFFILKWDGDDEEHWKSEEMEEGTLAEHLVTTAKHVGPDWEVL